MGQVLRNGTGQGDEIGTGGSPAGSNLMAEAVLRTVGPRIYVACLAAYNNGILYGAWMAADCDTDEIWADVQAMLRALYRSL